MLIRRAQERDIDQILELCALHAAHEKANYNATGKRDKLFHQLFEQATVQCLVAEEQTNLLGYATFIKQFATWEADHYLYLDCIYLREEIRGKGVGTKLMQLIKSYAEEERCFQMQWQTPAFNKSAIEFYKKLGAVSKSKERFFWS
ncbi:MAG: GNAT family N-acetyltransferase [Ekhidna sp.]